MTPTSSGAIWRANRSVPVLGLAIFLSLLARDVRADTFNWAGTGFFDKNFSTPDNWLEKSVPQAGDVCQFVRRVSVEGSFGLTDGGLINYDLVNGPRYGILRFNGAGPIRLAGQQIRSRVLEVSARSLGCEIQCTDGRPDVTVSSGIRTEAGAVPSRIELNHGGLLRIHGLVADGETRIIARKDNTVSIVGNNRVFEVPGPPNVIELLDGIGGVGAIVIDSLRGSGSGYVSFAGANTFTGPLTIEGDSTLRIDSGASLGSSVAGTTVSDGGILEIEMSSPRAIAEPMKVEGVVRTFVNGGGPGGELTVTGPLEFRAGSFELASPLRIETTLSGRGADFAKAFSPFDTEPIGVILSGSSANTLGDLCITQCDLVLDKPAGVAAVGECFEISTGSTATWNRNEQIPDSVFVVIGGGIADLNGRSETLRFLRMDSGIIRTGSTGSLRVNTAISSRGKFFSRIEGNLQLGAAPLGINSTFATGGNLEIAATTTPAFAGAGFSLQAGTLRLSGVCSAPATVVDGTLEANSISPLMAVTLDQSNTGFPSVLAGTGTVGNVTAAFPTFSDPSGGGIVSPGGNNGDSPGILRTGNFALNNVSAFRADIINTTPGTGFDQLAVTGTVALNNAELNLRAVFGQPVGSSFTILENDGSDPIIGTFAGLPQGATLGGRSDGFGSFTISYTGGSGNDVTLTSTFLPSGTTRTWSGAGADANWGTAANWSPSGRPQNGDTIVFPSGAARRTNINNITDTNGNNLALRAIRITGGPYQISGNGIALADGITVGGSVLLLHSLNLPITLVRGQTFSVGSQFLILGGAIDTNGMALTFDTQGAPASSAIGCDGVISEGAADQFVKTGDGRLNLTNANTTRGNFHIRQGVVSITNSAALGSRLGITIVDKSAMLFVGGSNLAVNETIQLAGTLQIGDNAGAPGFGDPIDCAASARLFVSATGVTQCNIFDELRGTALTKTGPGTLNLTGATPKSLSEGITIDEGRVIATGTAGTILLPGNTTVGVDPARSAILEIRQRRVTEADSQIIVTESGSVLCSSPEIAIAGLTLRGGTFGTDSSGIALNGALNTLPSAQTAVLTGRITLPDGLSDWEVEDGTAAVDLRVEALIREEVLTDARLRKAGPGTAVFTAANTIDTLTFQSGSNIWNSISAATDVVVTGGNLSGTGRCLQLHASDAGVVAPGGSPGLLTVGTLDLSAGGVLHFELNGTTPGSSHDQIRCTGDPAAVDLSGARLLLTPGFTPVPGTVLTLIDIQGSGAAVPIASLPEGATALTSGQRYRISYVGGNGNDVTLNALAPVSLTTLRITGFSIAVNQPSPGLRTLSGVVTGGAGAAGVGIEVEISDDLRQWEPFPLRLADENGNLPFSYTVRADLVPELFFRGRVP